MTSLLESSPTQRLLISPILLESTATQPCAASKRGVESAFRDAWLTWALALCCGLWLGIAAPASAYIVVLKDGSQIITEGEYRIEGEKAILVLQGGTQAFYDASDIDAKRTEELNKTNFGNARLIEGHKVTQLADDARIGEDRSLRTLASGRELALPPPRRRNNAGDSQAGRLRYTRAGFIDLASMPKQPLADPDIGNAVITYLQGQGVEGVKVFRGSADGNVFVRLTTVSEISVFKALEVAASGLKQIQQRFPEVAAFELLMVTEDDSRAGQFVLTPELADLLVAKRIDTAQFFLRYVEF